MENRERIKNVESRVNDCKIFIDMIKKYESFEHFMEDFQLKSNYEEKKEDSVVLSTVHKAKGLEWSVVFIVNCHQGVFPHERTLDDLDDFNDEVRLFYVAITRAKEHLLICNSVEESVYGKIAISEMSCFINLPEYDCMWGDGFRIVNGHHNKLLTWINQQRQLTTKKIYNKNYEKNSKKALQFF